ncbi:hypothetical protein JCM3263A_31480 [Thermobifida fusca]|uniref:Helix-turn-helix domain-containing protein n=2 Tax=Thermobifida fusca TaxID=2021 RepID=A0A9P2TA45_THEFU|nr:helix-turn-helix domain-containing protein [Thermobifida fusca]AAZ55833.1 hypothetical protein Tfu_1800 [Thermobifida fusca YX]EOR71128.1 hypothetical protein TM51_09276 [Thermobifida fusca TM51]MDD6791450.1 helix-turn-helix domain-containing protein [Thermobifida fusca]QOS58358.1 helix-turn-helix domain-containing protein [Thermobifida fusca]
MSEQVKQTGTLGGSNRLVTPQELADWLHVPVKTVYDRWRQWGLRPYKIGRHLRWLERDVLAWLERQRAAA